MPPLHQEILQQLGQVQHMSVEELALHLQKPRLDIFAAVVSMQSSGYIRQALPGRYAIQEAADFPKESIAL